MLCHISFYTKTFVCYTASLYNKDLINLKLSGQKSRCKNLYDKALVGAEEGFKSSDNLQKRFFSMIFLPLLVSKQKNEKE